MSPGGITSALISTDALASSLGDPHLSILDASWHMPSEKRYARKEYLESHIPGAVFFDIDAVSDHESPYPHMLPQAQDFAQQVSALGMRQGDDIVVYDSSGLFSAPRVWWMFRVFGHSKVRVLDGGLPKWNAEGRAVESGARAIIPGDFHPDYHRSLLRDKKQMAANIIRPHEIVLDARSPGRFSGTEPEPRPGLASGHIEGSLNVFFKDCLSQPFNTLKKPEELRALFAARGVEPADKLVATCGSGVTACILALALFELGNDSVAVYDGAWAEWGSGK
jgi:thiosulfate/3-mercaptopyruvate sulfurtransferase